MPFELCHAVLFADFETSWSISKHCGHPDFLPEYTRMHGDILQPEFRYRIIKIRILPCGISTATVSCEINNLHDALSHSSNILDTV